MLRIQYYNGAMYSVIEFPGESERTVTVYPSMVPDATINGETCFRYKMYEYGSRRYIWCGFGVHHIPFHTAVPVYIQWDKERHAWYLSDSDFSIPAWACPEHYKEILPF